MCLPQWAHALTEAQQLADSSAENVINPVRNQEAAVLEPRIA
jgi:hypothetical protein